MIEQIEIGKEITQEKTVLMNQRIRRGMAILAVANQIQKIDSQTYIVKSQAGNGTYTVTKNKNQWSCTCPDHQKTQNDCKHIHAIKLKQTWENSSEILDTYKELNEKTICKYCGSENIEKHGIRHNKNGMKQRYLCRECNKRFVVNDGFSKMKYDPEIITQALDLYFKGLSLRKVKDHFEQFLSKRIHHTTILIWIEKYTQIIDSYISNFKPELSNTWHTDEMMIRSGGKWSWLWHTMDRETRFMVANMISNSRTVEDARNLFKRVKQQAKSKPEFMVTDGLQSYHDAFNKEFYTNILPQTKHLRNAGIAKKNNNNMVERLHNTVREREKVMRGMQNNETAKVLMDGFRNYYNVLRPHMGIDNNTPAEMAGLNLELGRNKIQNLIKQSVEIPC
jgi:transposase-like protein